MNTRQAPLGASGPRWILRCGMDSKNAQPEYEFGSGMDCSAATLERECPMQCFWCVEARRCTSQFAQCDVAAADKSWPAPVLLLGACAALLIGVTAFSRRHKRNHGLRTHDHDDEQDCSNSYQLNRMAQTADRPHDLESRQPDSPEGQRLLNS